MVFRAEIEGRGGIKMMCRARAISKNYFKNVHFLSENLQEKNIETSPMKRRGGGYQNNVHCPR